MFDRLVPSSTADGDTTNKRSSSNLWIESSEDTMWIYNRIAMASKECNPWKLGLKGFFEPIQLAFYKQDDYYNWHVDSGAGAASLRKLSAVVQLSDPSDYEGGDLEFLNEKKDDSMREQGSIVFFPSYQVHRANPVISGQRFSLAIWMGGDPLQ